MKAININKILSEIDFSEYFTGARLLQIEEKFAYEDGKRTEKIEHYALTVIVPKLESTVVTVKVEKKPKVQEILDMPEVSFSDLTAVAWVRNQKFIELSWSAYSVETV